MWKIDYNSNYDDENDSIDDDDSVQWRYLTETTIMIMMLNDDDFYENDDDYDENDDDDDDSDDGDNDDDHDNITLLLSFNLKEQQYQNPLWPAWLLASVIAW